MQVLARVPARPDDLPALPAGCVGFALVACRPVTGRTHQIRLHLSYAGLPIMGEIQKCNSEFIV